VSDAAAAVEFLRTVFDATGDAVSHRPAEMRIGDSLVLVSEGIVKLLTLFGGCEDWSLWRLP